MNDVVASQVTITAAINEARAEEILSKGQVEDALAQVLKFGIQPGDGAAKSMTVMMHMRAKRMDEAKKVLDELLLTDPQPVVYKMLGDWHFLTNDYKGSEHWYGRTLEVMPGHPDTVHDKGVAIVSQGRLDEGITLFREAIKLAPDRHEFKHHLAIMLVLAGHPEEGWREMESRLHVPGVTGGYPKPECYWKGESLQDKSIVLRTEQGFGDTIMFLRYARLMHEAGARKIYAFCQPAMTTFIEHFFPYVEAWPNTAPPPQDFDYHICLMSLPSRYPGVYLPPPTVPTYPGADGIGICWFGSPTHKADHLRTMGFEPFQKLMGNFPKERWLCAAYGFFDQKPENVGYFVERCKDWLDTAMAFRRNLKLVITADTAAAHLAGFLGIPCWLLTPYVPDFRWGMSGENKWYQSIKLYRQPALFDWNPVFERVNTDLKELLDAPAI